MPRFETVIKSARFVYSPYTATEMQGFGQVLADSIRARIQSGQNIYDQGGGTAEARTGRLPWLPGLQGCPRTGTRPRLDVGGGQQVGINYDPTGSNTQGRITVVFRGSWSQARDIARTNVQSMVEVA
jgi:hypothetical protein